MGEWTNTTVGNVFDLTCGYAFKSSDFIDSGVPVIKIKNVKAGEFSEHDFSYVSEDFLKSRRDKLACFGDLLISMSGNRHDGSPETWVGKVAQFRKRDYYFINQRVGALRPKSSSEVDARFASYSLSSIEYQELFIAIATSSGGQANLSPGQILGAPFCFPPLKEQHAIAHILGTLDDKIELNRKMNETLEAMARALFKSWFVDFEPVRAKTEGRDTGLPQEIADLFPDSFEDSELGEVPKGWRVGTIGDLAEIVGGSTPSTNELVYWNNGLHCWATPKDLSNLSTPVLLETERKITDAGVAQISSGLLSPGTVLLSSRAPIGYLAIAEIPVAINQGFIAMKAKHDVSNLFLLLWTEWAHEDILGRANGSTFLEISKSNFRPILVVTPPPELFAAFDKIARPLYERIVSNERESRTLAAQRDTLLPKLLSGELRVNGLENMSV